MQRIREIRHSILREARQQIPAPFSRIHPGIRPRTLGSKLSERVHPAILP